MVSVIAKYSSYLPCFDQAACISLILLKEIIIYLIEERFVLVTFPGMSHVRMVIYVCVHLRK